MNFRDIKFGEWRVPRYFVQLHLKTVNIKISYQHRILFEESTYLIINYNKESYLDYVNTGFSE